VSAEHVETQYLNAASRRPVEDGEKRSTEVKDKKVLCGLICLTIILTMVIPLWSTAVRASPPVALSNRPDPDLFTVAESSGGVSLTGGWNLISLPVAPFDTSIESVLAPLAYPHDLISVWYYDCCQDEWLVYNNGDTGFKTLTAMEDGKAYWVRMRYPDEQSLDSSISGTYPYTLWVFGTKAPVPPGLPSSYNVCEGWNMVGFRSMEEMAPEDYLGAFSRSEYGAIYGWDPYLQDWVTNPDKLVPGHGYWIPFSVRGAIRP
jgi:hypothetical protein